MSDTHIVAKIVLVMGLVFMVVGLIFPGQDAAWTGVRTTLSQGPTLPTFNNPFASSQPTVTHLRPLDNALGYNAPAHGCSTNAYYNCLQSIDGNVSYISLQFVDAGNSCTPDVKCGTAVFNLQGGAPTHFTVTDFTVNVYCRATNPNAPAKFVMFIRSISDRSVHECPYSSSGAFQQMTFSFSTVIRGDIETGGVCYWSDILQYSAGGNPCVVNQNTNGHPGVQTQIGLCGITFNCPDSDGQSGPMDVTAVLADVTFTVPQASCGTFDMGCTLAKFLDPVIKFFQFIINGIVFLVSYIAAILAFIGGVVVGLFLGLFTTFAFLLAIPGAPPVVQGLVAVLVVGMGAMLLVILLKQFTAMVGGMNPL